MTVGERRSVLRGTSVGAALVLTILSAATAHGQSRGNCAGQLDPLLNRQMTLSGLILSVKEIEAFIEMVLFQDAKSGCQFTALEGLLDEQCKPGRSIVITGTLKRSGLTKGYEIDRGNDPADDTLRCR